MDASIFNFDDKFFHLQVQNFKPQIVYKPNNCAFSKENFPTKKTHFWQAKIVVFLFSATMPLIDT